MANNRSQEILDAYASVIVEKGFAKASFSTIAKVLEIPQSLIFHYFKNKEDMTHQLAACVFDRCEQSYFCRSFDGPADRALVDFMDHVFHIHEFRKDSVDTSLYYTFMNQATLDPVIRQSLGNVSDSTIRRLEEALRRFVQAGVIAPEDPALAARELLCLVDGLNCNWIASDPQAHACFATKLMVHFIRTTLRYTGDPTLLQRCSAE